MNGHPGLVFFSLGIFSIISGIITIRNKKGINYSYYMKIMSWGSVLIGIMAIALGVYLSILKRKV